MESKTEPHVHVFSQVGKGALPLMEGQVNRNARPPEWS